MMESLTLDKAMELYKILGAYIPEVEDKDIDAMEFISKVVGNIRTSDQHKDYVDAVMIMSNTKWEEVKVMTSEEVLELFIDRLFINRIVRLKLFCDDMGFSYA